MIARVVCRLIVLLFLFVSQAHADLQLSIPDPYDPVRRLPLDRKGRVACEPSFLDGTSPADCVRARDFYTSQFGKVDLRVSAMMDHIRPHPKFLIAAFLSAKGFSCSHVSGEKREACRFAGDLFEAFDPEERQSLENEFKEGISPITLVPLTGDFECSWAKLSRVQFQSCRTQNDYLGKMLFEERLKHNDRAMNILNMIQALSNLEARCRRGGAAR